MTIRNTHVAHNCVLFKLKILKVEKLTGLTLQTCAVVLPNVKQKNPASKEPEPECA